MVSPSVAVPSGRSFYTTGSGRDESSSDRRFLPRVHECDEQSYFVKVFVKVEDALGRLRSEAD
jgi:hypothetical protein